ncbi:hypothetical protein ACS0TY_033672 [Phlomoides rotata]
MRSALKSSKSSFFEIKGTKKYEDAEGLSTVARSVSLIAGGSKQRIIAEDILRHGVRAPAEVLAFRELAIATENFNPELLVDEGGFGRVYKGHLKKIDKVVAVKQLDKNRVQGKRDFLAEVLTLSQLYHPNLVSLIGYCADGPQRILVYEFMHNGSLKDHLQGGKKKGLDWQERMQIARGAARGMEYLHDTPSPPIIFRDFKASNILLDEELNPKLSGFGLAKLSLSGPVMGTYGYCAPEYARTGQLTTKSDVYSFGVVLLQIISGRKEAIDSTKPLEEENLVAWAKPLLRDRRKYKLMADPLLEGKYPMKGLEQALGVASMCLQDEATTRPLIEDVVTALEHLAITTDEEVTCTDQVDVEM